MAVGVKTPMLFLTATCTMRICESFEGMISCTATHYDWPSAFDIANRPVSLYAHYSKKTFANMSAKICGILKERWKWSCQQNALSIRTSGIM
mmetsp:Transcript_21475/g.31351  ORF Transcript_21475/g.31351 Transcript_21475/m.31351 type:complete len:92 (-) Transcript_21475:161-436(-)